jgi:hypothetical protein
LSRSFRAYNPQENVESSELLARLHQKELAGIVRQTAATLDSRPNHSADIEPVPPNSGGRPRNDGFETGNYATVSGKNEDVRADHGPDHQSSSGPEAERT